MSFFILKLGIGQVNFKWRKDELFSERNGYAYVFHIGQLSIIPHLYRKHPR